MSHFYLLLKSKNNNLQIMARFILLSLRSWIIISVDIKNNLGFAKTFPCFPCENDYYYYEV